MRHQLVGLLGGGIHADRVVDAVVHRERHAGIAAVDRRARGIDEVLHAGMPTALEHVHEADEVAVHVGMGVLQRIAHASLRREVDDAVEAFGREEGFHARPVGDVELDEAESVVRLQAGQPVLLEPDVVIVVEIVQADDLVAALEQAQGRGHADKSGSAGDKDLHASGREWIGVALRPGSP
jgi:hypothetical protein